MGYIYGIFRILMVGQPSGVSVLAMISVSFMFCDPEVAKGVVRRLEDAGVDCVHADLSRISDDELHRTLEYYLHTSAHSIVVTSPGVPPSPWVAYEAGFALALRHPWFVFGSSDDVLPPTLAEWSLLPDWATLDLFVRVYRESFVG
jgi:hypothetical protein